MLYMIDGSVVVDCIHSHSSREEVINVIDIHFYSILSSTHQEQQQPAANAARLDWFMRWLILLMKIEDSSLEVI